MRTALTLDRDVATQVERIQRDQNISLNAIINEALRQGLQQMSAKPAKRKPFRTKTAAFGVCLVGSIDDVAAVLEVDDGERLR